jgi:glycosyltransferase involved in cell wall biosynthesis
MNPPLLSICIPTYNRSGYLWRCLEGIKIQLDANPALNDLLEVVVSDNCSTDDTSKVAKSYIPHIRNLKYVVNETNVGFDLNIYNVVKNASGTYCWYLGDDDIIVYGGIEFMLKTLKNHPYDFVGVHSVPLPDKFESHDEVAGLPREELTEKSVVEITDFNDFYFKDYCQGGVSSLVFDRQAWLANVDVHDYLPLWLYFESVLRILPKTTKPLAFITQAMVRTGQDCRWAENGTELFTFTNSNLLYERLIGFGFDKKRVNDYIAKNSQRIPIILLRAKGHGLKCNLANLKFIYKKLTRLNLVSKTVVPLIYFIPNPIVRMVRDLKKKMA